MASIVKIEIEGFKAFLEHFSLDLPEGKNLLMYGENGSGKSSIYYALHALLQSVFKTDHGAKYFTHSDEENLINIYRINDVIAGNFHPNIKLTFNDGDVWTLNLNGVLRSTEDKIKLLNRYAIFINHSYISRFHAARNSEEIDLWNVFYKDILPFYLPPQKSLFLAETYEDIVKKCQRWPMPRLIRNGRFLRQISTFNSDLEGFINQINRKVSDIYNKYFKNIDDNDLDIKLCFFADNDPENTNHDEHYLFYGNNRNGRRFKKQLHNPNIGICIKENNVEINKPQTYFNEAKLTAIALSVRFACLSQHPIDGAFLALDDMLISLDMSNRTKVVNFLMSISDKYKIYLFTHDRLFYSTLKKRIELDKKRGEWLIGGLYMHDIDEKNNYQPCIPYPKFIENKDMPFSMMEYYTMHDYPACGQKLRKWCEEILEKLYPDTLKKGMDSRTHQTSTLNLNDRIANLSMYCEKEELDFQKYKNLKIYKDNILNTVSHYDTESPIYKEEILQIMKVLNKLNEIVKNRVIVPVNHEIGLELVKPNGTPITICINIRGTKHLPILLIEGNYRISYFINCSVKKIIEAGIHNDFSEERVYNSIYDIYNEYCILYGIPNTDNLLDVLQDHNTILRNKLNLILGV